MISYNGYKRQGTSHPWKPLASPVQPPNPYEILCRVLGRDQAVTVKLLRNF
jgi:hypothetical protein